MKISLSVLAGLLLHLQSMDASVIAGPILNPANGHYYLLLSAQSWTASESEAVSLGGHLATIGNQAENDFVYVTFGAFLGVTRSLWIGLNDAALEGTFRWTSGEPLTFVNWEFRSPNNIGGIEHYVHIEPNNSAWPEPGKWNDLSNRPGDLLGIPLNGVVELNSSPVPEPKTALLVMGALLAALVAKHLTNVTPATDIRTSQVPLAAK